MKRLIIYLTLLLTALNLNAQGKFAQYSKGDQCCYTCRNAKGDITTVFSIDVQKTEKGSNGKMVHLLCIFKDANGKALIKDNGELIVKIHFSEGETESFMDEIFKALAIKDYLPTTDLTLLPRDGKKGDIIGDATLKANVKNVSADYLIKDRKIVAVETITTPAGSFDCIKVEEKMRSSFEKKDYIYYSWYAKDIGYVKQLIHDPNGKLLRSLELSSYKKAN